MSDREEAIKWFNELPGLSKAKLVDSHVYMLKGLTRHENLTGRQIEMLFKCKCGICNKLFNKEV